MGFFSWKLSESTNPKKKQKAVSIPNVHQNSRKPFPVKMLAPDGREWIEKAYQGYGIFMGQDYYELVCELNLRPEGMSNRDFGIELAFNKNAVMPRFARAGSDLTYDELRDPEICDYQGFFYDF